MRRIESRLPVDGDGLHPAERTGEPGQGLSHDAERHAQLERGRGGRDRVVDVVEPRERQPDGELARGRAQLDLRALHSVEPHPGGGHLRPRALAPAVRTAVAAQMAEVDGVVDVGRAAVAAVLGVRGVLQARERLAVVLQAEVGHLPPLAAQVRHQRVVGVENEAARDRRARPRCPTSGPPAAPAPRSGRAGRGTGWPGAATAAARRGPPAAARPRRPRTDRADPARCPRRAAPWPRPRPCWSRPGCAPRGARHARARPRSSPPWWSCRSWPTGARSRSPARPTCGPARPGDRRSISRPGRRGAAASAAAAGDAPRQPGEQAGQPEHHCRCGERSRAGSGAPPAWSPAWRRSGRRRRRPRRDGRTPPPPPRLAGAPRRASRDGCP